MSDVVAADVVAADAAAVAGSILCLFTRSNADCELVLGDVNTCDNTGCERSNVNLCDTGCGRCNVNSCDNTGCDGGNGNNDNFSCNFAPSKLCNASYIFSSTYANND